MNILSSNVLGSILAALLAGGAIMFVGNQINGQLDQVTHEKLPIVIAQPSPSSIAQERTALSSSTPKPQVKAAQTTSDPIIACDFPHTGRLRVRQSECAGTKIDCEVAPGKWQVVWRTDCDALYAKQGQTTNTQASPKKPTSITPTPAIYPTYTPYVPEKSITCTVSTGTYQVTQDLCDQFKASDAKLLKDIADREEATFVTNVEQATAAYESCMKDAERFNEENKILVQQYPSLGRESLIQYGKLKQQCETNYPPL